MSRFSDIDSFQTHLQTLGLDTTLLQTIQKPTVSFRPHDSNRHEARAQSLHALPELSLNEDGDEESTRVPDLSMVETLGEGGMGIVRLAKQVALDREVAVKTTRQDVGEKAARSLLQEAYVTGYLEHPNIIPIYMVGRTAGGAPLIVMKRVEGTSWLDILADDRNGDDEEGLPANLVRHLKILLQVSNAAWFASSRGIIHRDIKLENVMVGHFDDVYLVDWGIAITLDADDQPLLPGRQDSPGLCGTPGYMAPEMAEQKAELLDARTDVYLLGATLHHVLTGKHRHSGQTLLQVLFAAHLSEPYEYGQDVPSELAEIANRACHRDPDKRFASAEEFRNALQAYLEHRQSISLSNSSEEKLSDLKELTQASSPEELTVHDTFGECRFGFYQALLIWPENSRAQRGLQNCLEIMITYHLEQRNLAAARACIADLLEPQPKLEQRADELEQQLDSEREDLERLKSLEHNFNLVKATGSRTLIMIILGVFWTATSLYAAVRVDQGLLTSQEELSNHVQSGFRNLGIVVLLIFAFRKRVLANAANRRLVYIFVTMAGAVAFLRWSVWYLDESLVLARTADSAIYVVTLIAVGLMSDLRICLISLAFVSAGIVGVVWPDFQLYASAIASAITFGGFAWIWSPSRQRNKISL